MIEIAPCGIHVANRLQKTLEAKEKINDQR